ncbi:uncharacterized protein PFL1_04292 [Pseudozyma flocculosa PF-1]|uniref:Protein ROT1 n=2 Tax=Pseudozyma flocculosa TaxID=84751 RepID=A0A5C3FB86_9BASI|nr:uncharacterized protein PFL1_04292 [Pseudozyma flocculosa PF-1]EPQ27965.1 hypothetical protein PFL1_04292 [Pseudozyma flocculosa PF-1]SPO41648.1 related to ROT1 - molecular chaperone in the endoplasmic reticulum [Pseudozyma flocculosa]
MSQTLSSVIAALLFAVCASLTVPVQAQNINNNVATMTRNLTGTWSTGSGAVLTGVNFYNPVDRSFTLPLTAGESYSFTSDGFWEQASVKWISNPSEPDCPTLHAIWQHGTYQIYPSNNTVHLEPFWGDGHQYMSAYCSTPNSQKLASSGPSTLGTWMGVSDKSDGTLAAYNQMEEFRLPTFDIDLHYGVPFDVLFLQIPSGKRKNRLYKYLDPPQMLPTEQLHVEVYGAM